MEAELTLLYAEIESDKVDPTSELAVLAFNNKVNRYNKSLKSHETAVNNYNAKVQLANKTRTRRIYFVSRYRARN